MSDDEIYEYLGERFEWNRIKAAKNVLLHGVRFPEAASVFFDRRSITLPDDEHSESEQRYTVIGQSIRTRTRIISARRPTPEERRDYES
jgi:uncharacterized DUF497 family protein